MSTLEIMPQRETVPRGRHAPPLEVRLDRQRRRLFAAAATVFTRCGYADATAEGIAREAGMSKATFYEHFDNKEDCIIALFDAAMETLFSAMGEGSEVDPNVEPIDRYRRNIGMFLAGLAAFPDTAQTRLVEIVGACPRAMERRDRVFNAFSQFIYERNRVDAEAGRAPRFASADATYAVVGAIAELAARQLRCGRAEQIQELEPVLERLVRGLLLTAEQQPASA